MSRKIVAVVEVFALRFLVINAILLGLRALPGVIGWQEQQLGYVFSTDLVFIAVALAAIWLRRKSLIAYGLSFRPLRYHLDIAATCFIPVVLAGMPVGLGVDYRTWGGGLIMAGAQIALLIVVAWLLRNKPELPQVGAVVAGLALAPLLAPAPSSALWRAAMAFLYYLLVGLGEETIYRGYIQSRLSEAFGRPFRLLGVDFGWGLPIAALVFGLSHAGLVGLVLGEGALTWPWALWTFFGGLVFGWVREKSGSVLAPALLHGLPQALITAAMALAG